MTSGHATSFAAIMFLTGVGIPILAALNGGLGTRLGSPMAASVILFGLALFIALAGAAVTGSLRSEEHTSELQSLMRISYAVFCLKKKNRTHISIKKSKKNYRTTTQ